MKISFDSGDEGGPLSYIVGIIIVVALALMLGIAAVRLVADIIALVSGAA